MNQPCAEFAERLPLLIYPASEAEQELAEVAAHVLGCAVCQATREELEAVAEQLDAFAVPTLEDRRAFLQGVLEAIATSPAQLSDALNLVQPPALKEAERVALREAVLARVGHDAPQLSEVELEAELEAWGASLAPALETFTCEPLRGAQRAAFAEGVLARLDASAEASFEDVEAALERVPAPTLGEAQRAAFAEGVFARIGEQDEASFEDVEAALDRAPCPSLSPTQRAAFAEGVFARLSASDAAEFDEVEAALDLVPAPALSETQSAAFREGVLLRAARASEADDADLCAALDRFPAPALSPAQRAAFSEGVLARVQGGDAEDFSDVELALDQVVAPGTPTTLRAGVFARLGMGARLRASSQAHALHAGTDHAGAEREGRVLRFPALLLRAAAGFLIASLVGLGAYSTLPSDTPIRTAHAVKLEEEAEGAEKLARAAASANEEVLLRESARRYGAVARGAANDPGARQVAKRARHQLLALELLEPGQRLAAGSLPEAPSHFLIRNEQVLRDFPDTVAALHVLKRYKALLRSAGRVDFEALKPTPGMEVAIRQITRPFLKQDRREFVHRDRATLTASHLRFDQLKLKVPLTVSKAAQQALLLQRGLHAEEEGDLAQARRDYQAVVALDGATPAAANARERLLRLG